MHNGPSCSALPRHRRGDAGSRPLQVAMLALTATLFAGCATTPAPAPAPERITDDRLQAWQAHREQLQALSAFRLQGRLSGQGPGSAQLSWNQRGERFTARASGPFGAGALALSGSAESVRIRHGDSDLTTTDPEDWMRRQLGWSLPVAALRYWVLGLPQPGRPARYGFDASGRLRLLEQAGWRIEYAAHGAATGSDEAAAGPALPGRIRLGDGRQQLLLRIDAWRLPSPR